MKQVYFLFLIFLSQISIFSLQAFNLYEERWPWEKIDCNALEFPKNFLWGTASSAMQTEGVITAHGKATNNSWTAWEEEEITRNGVTEPRIPVQRRVGSACEHWTRYQEDLKLAADIGIKAHRFSLEWSKIEPEKGVFDADAMDHYIDYCWELIKNGIIPIPTLFHHTWPLWFNYDEQDSPDEEHRKPAFEDFRNIEDFVAFAVHVFTAFKEAGLLVHIRLWLTFNEPVAHALAAYVYNKYPPGKRFKFKLCGIVAKNMLDAHIAAYHALKEIDPDVKIGIAHMMQPIQPYHPWNPLDQLPAKIFNYLLNEVTLVYLKTGYFNWAWLVKEYNSDAVNKVDFIGINYYTHTLLKMFKEKTRPDEQLSDPYDDKDGKALYAEGFYTSLKRAAMLGVPILITENGFATDNSELREEYIKKHLYVLYKLINEGIDIRGYLFWTLTDCFGWNSALHSKHGMFKVNFETQERELKENISYLLHVMNHRTSFTKTIEPLTPLIDAH